MAITHVHVVSVPVSDQDRALDFYVNVLGFELIRDTAEPGARWVQVAPPGARTCLALINWLPSMSAGSLRGFTVESDDLDGEIERMASLGVNVSEGVREHAWGRSIGIADPDGNRIIVQHSTRR